MKIKDGDNEEELSKQMNKQLSTSRAIFRIIIGFIAIIIWFLIGVNITVIFSSMIQQTLGFTSYFYKNPIIFLLVAFLNIILGLIAYFFVGILWWAAFHLLWSIRWFAGYIKYHKIK
ncbi:MAG: hypothetical protein ACXVH2_07325 [Methanobacterium sp.]